MKKSLRLLSFVMLAAAIAVLGHPNAALAHGAEGGKSGCHLMSKSFGRLEGNLKGAYFTAAHSILKHQEKLGLTADKITAMEDLKNDIEKQLVTQNAEIKVVELDLKNELGKEKVNAETVNRLVDQKFELEKAQTKNLLSALIKLKGMLTPEQTAQLKDLSKSSKTHHHFFNRNKDKEKSE